MIFLPPQFSYKTKQQGATATTSDAILSSAEGGVELSETEDLYSALREYAPGD